VAEVGKTKIWVQVTSCGVERAQLTEVWLKRSSGVNWSGIIRRAESGSNETRHALNTEGASPGYPSPHCRQMSFKCFEAFNKDFLLRSQLQPIMNNINVISMIKNIISKC
jgi:hypothetical protein